jgi:glycosyltransferase involved in cell wall biosynthesis
LDIPIINTEHNSFERPIYAPMPRRTRRDKYKKNKRYAAVTVLTDSDRRCIGDKLKNVFVLPNPLTYAPIKEIPYKEKLILAAGRFDVWHCKGFDLLIKAWGMIADKNKEWTLYIAGTGTPKNIEVIKIMEILPTGLP